MSPTIQVADPKTASQLVSGFYEVSNHQWRWTARQFSVYLAPPVGGGQKGGELTVNLYFPDTEMKELGSITLTAYIADYELQSVTFRKSGAHQYRSDVPPAALCTDLVPVQFIFDKALPPSIADLRELGGVVTSISLRAQ